MAELPVWGQKEGIEMDLKQIKALIEMVNNSKLEQLEVETKDMKIALRNATEQPNWGTFMGGAPIAFAAPQATVEVPVASAPPPVATNSIMPEIVPAVAATPAVSAPASASAPVVSENYKYITAPLVGIFKSLEAAKKPAVKVGDRVNAGDSVCVVEAMKLINEIETEFSGEIVEILVQEGDTVEFGQKLFAVR